MSRALEAIYRQAKKKGAAKLPRAARRDEIEPEVFKVLEAFGMTVYKTDQPFDALVGFRGVTYLVEVKSGTKGYAKGLNSKQTEFALWWRGSPPIALHSTDDALAWAQKVARGG